MLTATDERNLKEVRIMEVLRAASAEARLPRRDCPAVLRYLDGLPGWRGFDAMTLAELTRFRDYLRAAVRTAPRESEAADLTPAGTGVTLV